MDILVVFPKICYMEMFDITNPHYNENIFPVPWHYVKLFFAIEPLKLMTTPKCIINKYDNIIFIAANNRS